LEEGRRKAGFTTHREVHSSIWKLLKRESISEKNPEKREKNHRGYSTSAKGREKQKKRGIERKNP